MTELELAKIYVTICDFRLQELYEIANKLIDIGIEKAGLEIGAVCVEIEKTLRPIYKKD